MNDSVWLLWFEQERSDGEDTELLIGVYRTEEAARPHEPGAAKS
jgi:hypothetical protein